MRGHVAKLCLSALAALLLLPAGAAAHGAATPEWRAPTPPNGAAFTVVAGKQLRIDLAANAASIDGATLPAGATVVAKGTGRATVTWTPAAAGDGQFAITVVAHDGEPADGARRTYIVWVAEPVSRPRHIARWAFVEAVVPARTHPHSDSPVVLRVPTATPERTQNLLLVLARHRREAEDWLLVRLAALPNNTTAWVPRSSLGAFRAVRTHLVVDRARFTATLYRSGKAIFRTTVGVGKSYWPTPRGEFYIRNKLTGFRDPLYGVLAFGTSARSNVLTDWPGGGYIGIHGTFKPELLPGRVSHGCVRMRNEAILRLSRLMPVGTPLTIR